jgi:CDP-glucose 4,6-dehydratase
LEDVVAQPSRRFWASKRVLLTGHTGFKGAWAARMLAGLGARVTGFALDPVPGSSAFAALEAGKVLHDDRRGDLRDADALREATAGADIVLHMAAQAIVSEGFRDPAGTWASNVTGTLNLLTALRGAGAEAVVVVTSDKVYRNDARRAFVETDALGGGDPYSASKAACEILVESHRAAFADLPRLATARAGNVIGGGDFGRDRLIPDLVRARLTGAPLALRSPGATRPFQHVLDVVAGYLLLAEALAEGGAPEAVNFGPDEAELSVTEMLAHWEKATGEAVNWKPAEGAAMAEKPRLALDSTLARTRLGWTPRLSTAEAVADTATWYRDWAGGATMAPAADAAIRRWIGA